MKFHILVGSSLWQGVPAGEIVWGVTGVCPKYWYPWTGVCWPARNWRCGGRYCPETIGAARSEGDCGIWEGWGASVGGGVVSDIICSLSGCPLSESGDVTPMALLVPVFFLVMTIQGDWIINHKCTNHAITQLRSPHPYSDVIVIW